MSRPIVLWSPRQATSVVSDDAGTTILKATLPPTPNPGPYEHKSNTLPQTSHFVPSLAYFALKILAEYPDQLDLRFHRLYYQPPSSPSEYDILRALIPSYDPRPESESEFSLTEVDPRLWAVLVQVYNNLPEVFRTYPIPLSDRHLPLLQRIQSTSEFSMITVLDLGGCKQLTDETTVMLKDLYGLCAFDASGTVLSAYGVKVMSRTLERSGGMRRGPWGLRILRLRNCQLVDNSVYACLSAFPLLSVVDLRGTKCIPDATIPDTFRPGSNKNLYYPTPLTTSLHILSSSTANLFSSADSRPFILHIMSLHHKAAALVRSRPSVTMQDTYIVIPAVNIKKESGIDSSYRSSSGYQRNGKGPTPNITVGNSEVLARRNKRMEELKRHEGNKEAWYERNSIRDQRFGMGMSKYRSSDMDAGQSLTMRPISPLATPSTPSQIDFQNSIAGEVASRQSVAQFYRSPSTHPRPLASRLRIQRSDHDELLMLYRKPPLWSDLDAQLNAATKVDGRQVTDLAVLSRMSVKGTNGMKALAETIKRRKDALRPAQAHGGTVSGTSSKVESRNPFRKKEQFVYGK